MLSQFYKKINKKLKAINQQKVKILLLQQEALIIIPKLYCNSNQIQLHNCKCHFNNKFKYRPNKYKLISNKFNFNNKIHSKIIMNNKIYNRIS